MRNWLAVFAVSLAVSFGLALLALPETYIRAEIFQSAGILYSTNFLVLFNASTVGFLIVDVLVVLAVFYYLGKKQKIKIAKSVTLALFLGIFIGSSLLFLYGITASPQRTLYSYLSFLTGFATSALLQEFFPALSALLYAGLKEKKPDNGSTVQYPSSASPTEPDTKSADSSGQLNNT